MTYRIAIFLSLPVLLAACSTAAPPQATASAACAYDRPTLLGLDQERFDQDHQGGWRALAARPGCSLAAADLLRDYRQAHGKHASLLFWHEAQLRASAGQPEQAIVLMERAKEPAEEDLFGWNPYVDASVAFLRRDRRAFEQAHAALAALPPQGPVQDGYMEIRMGDGKSGKVRWPPNIDVVEGLAQCFGQAYEIAYSNACRPQQRSGGGTK